MLTTKTNPEELQKPMVHLNGSGGKQLAEAYRKAFEAINEAANVLCSIAPHARDYYVISDSAYQKAANQHRERVLALALINEELLELFSSVDA